MKFQGFKEYCEFELPSDYNTVNEMPTVFLVDVNPRYIDANLMKHIKHGIANKLFVHVKGNVFCYPISKIESIYVVIDPVTKLGVGATNVEPVMYCNNHYMKPKIVKKFIEDYSGLALELYKTIAIDTGYKIISDQLQSESASTMWKKWYINPSKYGIKEVDVIDTTNKDCKSNTVEIDDIWGTDKDKMNKLVWIKF